MYHRYKIVLLICFLLLLCTQNFSFAQGQVTFNPTDDSFVLSSSPTSNRGAASDLRIRAGSKTIYTYLKFDVNALGGAVLSAKIRLKVLNGGDDGGTIFSTANAWDEGSIIFNNAPPTTGSALSSAGAVAVDDIVEFDVTSAISGTGIYSFRIHSGSSDRVLFSSKEGSVAPELVIQYASGGNLPPVANAGPDQTVTDSDNSGSENVTLDGSGSSDPDGSIASYDWSEGGTTLASGVNPTVALTVGVHTIVLKVTDNQGATATDQVVITVNAPSPNQPPVANAGPDQTVTDSDNSGSENVTLNGSGSSDPDGSIVSYDWSEGGTTLASGVNPTVALTVGVHTIVLKVTDNQGATATDQVVVTVNAGGGGGSGIVSFNSIADAYVRSDKASENLGSSSELRVKLTGPEFDTYVKFEVTGISGTVLSAKIRLKVTNASNDGGTIFPASNAWDEATITYNNAPGFTPTPLHAIGPVASGSIAEFDVTPAINGNGTFSFCISSDSKDRVIYSSKEGSVAPELVVEYLAGNIPPTANAGADQTVTDTDNNGSESVALNGSLSNDADGTIVSYVWKESGSQIAAGVNPTVALTMGTHTITLIVTDNEGATGTDQTVVTVNPPGASNQPPVANAGPDQTVTDSDNNGSENVTLDGSGSSDPDGSIVSYDWSEGGTTIANGVNALVNLTVGVHTIDLTVTDNQGATATDQVVITVNAPSANQPPVANAGPDQMVTDSDNNGSENVTLDGSGSSDPDGSIVSYDWSEGGTTLASGVNALVNLTVGVHTIDLTVTDNQGATATDQVVVIVNAGSGGGSGIASFNSIADAYVRSDKANNNLGSASEMRVKVRGPEFKTYLKFNVTGISGAVVSAKIRLKVTNSSNDGGTIFSASNTWDEATITYNNAPAFTPTPLYSVGAVSSGSIAEFDVTQAVNGNGTFSFCISNNTKDRVIYSSKEGSVAPELVVEYLAGNIPPTANAGAEQTVTDTDNNGSESVALDGSLSNDADGSIVSYVWSESGSQIAAGVNPAVILTVGAHTITLTVTDNEGAIGTDQTMVSVNPPGSSNQPPVASAGPDQTVTDSDNNGAENIALNGTGSTDSDGSIVSHIWSEGGVQIAAGAMPIVSLAVGTHTITLTVTDDQGATGADEVVVHVDPAGGGTPVTDTFTPTDDAYTRSASPNGNYGSGVDLRVRKSGSSDVVAYLKFNVTGLNGNAVSSAKIRLKVTDGSNQAGFIFSTSNDWTESTVTHLTAPPTSGALLSSVGAVVTGAFAEFDVSGAITGEGTFSFCIFNATKNVAKFSSKEGATAPELILNFTPNQQPTVDAGIFQLIDMSVSTSTVLNGSASDDGFPMPPGALSYQWLMIKNDPNHPPETFHPPDPGGGVDQVVFSPNANVLQPTLTFLKDGLYTFRLTVTDGQFTVFDEVQVLALVQGLIPGPLSSVPVPGPDNLAAIDPNLSSEINSTPVPFSDFIVNKAAAIRLGKALFWDMQVGSDGVQACASCHFHSGIDSRATNELHPGSNGTFDVGPLNHTLSLSDFPYHKLANTNDRHSTVLSDVDDITGAQGVTGAIFNDIIPSSAVDDLTPIAIDNPYYTGTFNVRRTTGRNAPPAINAVFNFRNFWDGRAFNNFNGVNPFGNRDAGARVVMDTDGAGGVPASAVSICIPLSSAASQATGPPNSPVEMSGAGRTWPKIGKKMLSAGMVPLGKQKVDPTDSVLGLLSNSPANGLNTTYAAMIMAAFNSKWWDSDNIVTFNPDGSIDAISGPPPGPLTTDQYTLMEANFSLFFALAVQCYEATLISDDAPFDRFRSGTNTALTAQQQRGMKIFTNFGLDPTVPAGFCINCHVGPEFTSASVSIIGTVEPPQPFEPPGIKEMIIERMPAALGGGKASLEFVIGDAIPPGAGHTQFPLDFDPRGKLIEIKDASTGTLLYFGTMPGVPGPLPPTSPCINNKFAVPLFSTGVITDPLAIASANMRLFSNCSVTFSAAVVSFPIGFYDLYVDGIKRGVSMEAIPDVVYDIGFYNIGIRQIFEDIGNGGGDPFGNPLSFTKMELLSPGRADIRKGVPGGGLGGGEEITPPVGSLGDPPAVDGAFKTPSLRNVELSGPYFHNGSQATLRQVVDFYNRGGDFSDENLSTLDPEIRPLGLTEQDKDDLVAFLLSLTDERVRTKSAPFDHPQFFVPDGHDPVSGVTILMALPAVGAAGGPPIQPFLNSSPFLAKSVNLTADDKKEKEEESQSSTAIPGVFALEQNYPNPFNPSTTIHFSVARPVKIRLDVFNILGQKVRTLTNEIMPAGLYSVTWDGQDDNGRQLVSGMYIYRMQTPSAVLTKRMLMVK